MKLRIYISVSIFWLVSMLFQSCHLGMAVTQTPAAGEISWVIDEMNQVMMHDITNPPLSSRFFAYTMLAGYEALAQSDTSLRSLTRSLHDYPTIHKPEIAVANPELAAIIAMLETASRLQPSGQRLVQSQGLLIEKYRKLGVSRDELEALQTYGRQLASAIVSYARQDGYRRISDYPRYTPPTEAGHWFPTPPSFSAAVEPHFNKIRPLVIDSAAAFKPVPPTAFQTGNKSLFYGQMAAVCQAGQHLTAEQKAIAMFWDCNPFAVQDAGHLQIGLKKMAPSTHWMKIAGTVCGQAHTSFNKTLLVHTVLAITMMDAFISCWDEKYRSNRIRPETAVRAYMDPSWRPLLQTPPFPEYVSGHSVVSAASAEVLTHFFGNKFAYTDSTEIRFGLAPRRFTSFRMAAQEAGISRFYGGIHFMDSVEEGLQQGKRIGLYVLATLGLKPGSEPTTVAVAIAQKK